MSERNNAAERAIGAVWESHFCRMGTVYGKVLTAHQLRSPNASACAFGAPLIAGRPRRWLLPDITIWSAPGEDHEVKHKNQSFDGCYGLEVYRLDALVEWAVLTGRKVYYTIHDWEIAGASCSSDEIGNSIDHWFTADVLDLRDRSTKNGRDWTWRNGKRALEDMRYWTPRHFGPLAELWTSERAPGL